MFETTSLRTRFSKSKSSMKRLRVATFFCASDPATVAAVTSGNVTLVSGLAANVGAAARTHKPKRIKLTLIASGKFRVKGAHHVTIRLRATSAGKVRTTPVSAWRRSRPRLARDALIASSRRRDSVSPGLTV